MANLDLNLLRRTLQENASSGQTHPIEPHRKIVVGRDGKIRHGNELGLADQRELSEVPQDLFAGLVSMLRQRLFGSQAVTHVPPVAPVVRRPGGRLARDRAVVREKLPLGTKEISVAGTMGFVYQITDEFGESYTMVIYFDGSEYQVKVVAPEIEGHYGVAAAHVFSDGRLCLRPPAGGMPTLAEAYAKSVLWATGFTVFRRKKVFPWPSH